MQVLQVGVVDLLCDDAAQTQLLRRAGGGFREVVQVIDEGGAEFDGLHGPSILMLYMDSRVIKRSMGKASP